MTEKLPIKFAPSIDRNVLNVKVLNNLSIRRTVDEILMNLCQPIRVIDPHWPLPLLIAKPEQMALTNSSISDLLGIVENNGNIFFSSDFDDLRLLTGVY